MNAELVEWVLAAALYFAPIETRPKFAGYEETHEEALARYRSIAEDIVEAAEKSPNADKWEAAWLVTVAVGESGLSLDVDRGPCYRRGGYRSRCDGGSSFSIWQLKNTPIDGELRYGYEFERNRKLAARAALKKIRGSLGLCKSLPENDRLSAYGVGRCVEGNKSVRARHALFEKVRSFVPKPPKADKAKAGA